MVSPTCPGTNCPGAAIAGHARVVSLASLTNLTSLISRISPAATAGVEGALAFEGVHFAYASGPEVLKGVSLRIEAGETVAIVGPSGAGKSTLARLILRLADPSEGTVRIDGIDLRDVTFESLRRAVTVVFQEPYILRGSMRDNMGYGRPDTPDERVAMMARAAHVDEFAAKLRNGYDAPTGPRGSLLSGGQRQRLALARAFLRSAPILVLDEATASVDSETEELIQDAVERFSGRRTIVVIAHRLSSVRRADRVVVLDGGRIVETGAPGALLAGNSRCRDLFAAQIVREAVAA